MIVDPKAGSVTGRGLVTQNKPHVGLWYSRLIPTASFFLHRSLALSRPQLESVDAVVNTSSVSFWRVAAAGEFGDRPERLHPAWQDPSVRVSNLLHRDRHLRKSTPPPTFTHTTTTFAADDNRIHNRQYHLWRQCGDDRGEGRRARSCYLAPAQSPQVRVHKRRHCA